VVGRIGSVVRVKVTSDEKDDASNNVLIGYLAEFFEVQPKAIHIMRGEKAKEKMVQISGRSEDELERVLESIP